MAINSQGGKVLTLDKRDKHRGSADRANGRPKYSAKKRLARALPNPIFHPCLVVGAALFAARLIHAPLPAVGAHNRSTCCVNFSVRANQGRFVNDPHDSRNMPTLSHRLSPEVLPPSAAQALARNTDLQRFEIRTARKAAAERQETDATRN